VNEIRFGVVRAISDSANESSTMDFGEFCKMAADNTAELVDMFIGRYGK
jgi:adenosylhomocysteine nucleosidase